MGKRALRRLGFRAHRAHRAADLFRRHDLRSFEQLAPLWGEEERYILASRDAAQTMDKLLSADLASMRPGEGEDWDRDADEAERRARQVEEEN
jgi:glutathione-regulated potassium-efflux system ancillary protein KefC/glutathione-regulated potassium-efflux system protein KefB